MTLSDQQIRERLFAENEIQEAKKLFREEKFDQIGKRLLITPISPASLSGSSYDLRVGKRAISFSTGQRIDVEDRKELLIQPGEFVGILTLEYVGLPLDLMGAIRSSTTMVLQGLSHVSTRVHPGYYGNMMIPVTNVGNQVISLRFEQAICNVSFDDLGQPASGPYRGSYKGLEDIWNPIVSSVKLWQPIRKDQVTPQMMDEAIRIYGPPFDVVAGMLDKLENNISTKFRDEWGPNIKKDLISYTDKRVIKLLMALVIPLAASIILGLLALVVPLIVHH
jgi:deoxycytidine triphosphate deaminase